jgi:signal transduction histidine kinase
LSAHVLIVDDEESIVITLRGILERAGYRVDAAMTIDAGLEKAEQTPFDVVLLDLRLGSDSGLTVLERLQLRKPSPVTIILTGYGSLETSVQALRHGAFDYLLKPCDIDELKATIARGLAQRAAEAEAASRDREQFLAVAAHELKTPVTSLRGYAQLLLSQLARHEPADPDRLRRAMQVIDAQTGRLDRLVQHLLDGEAIARGDLAIHPVPTDLAALIQRAVRRAQQRSSQHAIETDLPESLEARVDPVRLEQVVDELLDNAIRYSPAGGTIRVVLAPTAADAVRLSVQDLGPGVPVSQRGELFRRLTPRADGARVGGLGLGLYLCREAVEQHGGQITAEFPAEGGSRFVVTLPSRLAILDPSR